MKRYSIVASDFHDGRVVISPDGEWVHYEGHCEAMKRLSQQPQREAPKYCSDERPCINCFADNGPCLDAPVVQGLTDEQIEDVYRSQVKGRMMGDGVPFHIRYARAILAQAAPAPSASPAALTDYSYQQLFNAIAAATKVTCGNGHIAVSVIDFLNALLAASPTDHGEDARDAARYRWLRETGRLQAQLVGRCAGDKLDAAIDAAMSANKEGA